MLPSGHNSRDGDLVPAVVALLNDPAPVLRGAAVWALAQLDGQRAETERAKRLSGEIDDDVMTEWGLV
jgi:epoxyqueuosine reductase